MSRMLGIRFVIEARVTGMCFQITAFQMIHFRLCIQMYAFSWLSLSFLCEQEVNKIRVTEVWYLDPGVSYLYSNSFFYG